MERYNRVAYAIAYDMTGTHEDAEDISQETFIKVYQSIKSSPAKTQPQTEGGVRAAALSGPI